MSAGTARPGVAPGVAPLPPGSVVLFDVDGTLLDSEPGIVSGLRYALQAVGVTPPGDERLRSDLGPPLRLLLGTYGVPAELIEDAITAYRRFYFAEGLDLATPYAGIADALAALRAAGLRLGTATAKRTDVARALLERQGLLSCFDAVHGTEIAAEGKEQTVRTALLALGAAGAAAMIGDRHFDVSAGLHNHCVPIGAGWGYGSRDELVGAGAVVVADRPSDLVRLLVPH